MKIITIVFPIAALAGGIALGWSLHPEAPSAVESKVEAKRARASKRVEDVGGDSAREALRRRVKELEREIADLRAERSELPSEAPTGDVQHVEVQRRHGPPDAAFDFRAHLEDMKKNDPERYAQFTNGWARSRAFRMRRAANRLDTLASVDTSRMTNKERLTHQKLQELIAREQELHDMTRPDNADITDEERGAIWKELNELRREKRDLERTERNTLLAKAAESYGVKGAEAKELVETVKAVYEVTDSGWGGGWHRGERR